MSNFNDLIFNNNTFEEEELDAHYDGKITIKLEQLGKKKNTYIYNLKMDTDELKKHIAAIKKAKGCCGTIQKIPENKNDTRILFQGDHRDYIKEYLIKNCDIDEDAIIFSV